MLGVLGGWQALHDGFVLREVFISGSAQAPASGDSPDDDRHALVRIPAEDTVFHGPQACAYRERHAGCSAHRSGFVERYIFTGDGRVSLGRRISRVLVAVLMRTHVGQRL